MSDDPEEIRAAARTVRGLASRARAEAHHVTVQSHLDWEGLASKRYRDRLRDRARDFTDRAGDLDDLARALLAHARHVEDHERAVRRAILGFAGDVREIGHDVETIAEDVNDLVGDLAGMLP